MSTETTEPQCTNCGAELLGPHCYACGQPVKGMVRHFSSIVGDLFDTLLALDSRIVRTLGPLLVRPGFLSREYFAGRRVRYVSPVRLFIFLCLTAFFIAQISSDWNGITVGEDDIDKAATVEEVERLRDEALEELAEARRESEGVAAAQIGLDAGEAAVREKAEARIAELEGEGPAPDPLNCVPSWGGRCLEPGSDRYMEERSRQSGDGWEDSLETRIKHNARRIRDDPNLFKKVLFDALPWALLVMLPFFALMLRFIYLFSRRLYMEHLIVALHSHAFLCLALLLMVVLIDVRGWLQAYYLGRLLPDLAMLLLVVWMPIYLLLMQRRVYGQGWVLTLVKYWVLGVSYLVLLCFAITFAFVTSLVQM